MLGVRLEVSSCTSPSCSSSLCTTSSILASSSNTSVFTCDKGGRLEKTRVVAWEKSEKSRTVIRLVPGVVRVLVLV